MPLVRFSSLCSMGDNALLSGRPGLGFTSMASYSSDMYFPACLPPWSSVVTAAVSRQTAVTRSGRSGMPD